MTLNKPTNFQSDWSSTVINKPNFFRSDWSSTIKIVKKHLEKVVDNNDKS
jgi:hypothetical protein